MNAVQEIQEILRAIGPGEKNRAGGIYLNTIKNEFITFPGRVVIPKIPVKDLPYEIAVKTVAGLRQYFPEFLLGHALLEKRRPAADLHSLQFAMPMKGRLLDFTHFFKMDLRFGGDSSNVVEKGDTTLYPSFNTNRIYYKSRLIPSARGDGDEFSPVQIFDEVTVESDMHFRTFAVFDDVGTRTITRELLERLDLDVFSVSKELYPFIVFDFFTACFNVPNPTRASLDRALDIFEPLFFVLFGRYRSTDALAQRDTILTAFPGRLEAAEGALAPTASFIGEMKDYFRQYSIIRDDDLALKGWWKLEISAT